MFEKDRIYVENLHSVIYVRHDPAQQKRMRYGPAVPNFELIYNLSGEYEAHFNGAVLPMKADTLAFLPRCSSAEYTTERIEAGACFDIFFDTKAPMPQQAFCRDVSDRQKVKILFRQIFACWINREPGYYYRSMALLYEILAELQPEGNYLPRAQYDKIRPGLGYLQAHCFDRDVDYTRPAVICGISATYFKRLFKQKYGVSPHAYVTNRRLERAAELLQTGCYRVGDVGHLCGYPDEYYFQKVFKRRFGVSPGRFIRQEKLQHEIKR